MATRRIAYGKTHVGATFQLFGFEELQAKFARLPDKIERNVAKDALKAGLEPVLHTARALCPVGDDDGKHLVSTLKITGFRSRNYRFSMLVTAGMSEDLEGVAVEDVGHLYKGDFYYAGMVEWGHRIGKRRSGVDAKGNPKNESRGSVPAQPFLRPALDNNRENVGTIVSTMLANGIKREFAKGN